MAKMADCHPDRPHSAKGLCDPCYNKRWCEENAEKKAEYDRRYHAEHAEEIAERKKHYRAEHAEQIAEQKRHYYKEHAEERREYGRRHQKEHPEQRAEHRARRKAWKLQSPAIPMVLEPIDSRACFYCGKPAEQWDHFIPLSRGGGHLPGNMVPACAACNLAKRTKMPEDYLIQMELA